ncbi:MAG: hypothetical protein MJ213_05690, partial [Bacilli bacterium]|nr:hypothetical protein [Bacilli bacterium]
MKAKSLKFVFASLALALGVGLMPKGEDVYQQLNSPFQSALNSTGVSVDDFNLFKDDVGASLNNIQNGINGMQKSSKMSKNLNIAKAGIKIVSKVVVGALKATGVIKDPKAEALKAILGLMLQISQQVKEINNKLDAINEDLQEDFAEMGVQFAASAIRSDLIALQNFDSNALNNFITKLEININSMLNDFCANGNLGDGRESYSFDSALVIGMDNLTDKTITIDADYVEVAVAYVNQNYGKLNLDDPKDWFDQVLTKLLSNIIESGKFSACGLSEARQKRREYGYSDESFAGALSDAFYSYLLTEFFTNICKADSGNFVAELLSSYNNYCSTLNSLSSPVLCQYDIIQNAFDFQSDTNYLDSSGNQRNLILDIGNYYIYNVSQFASLALIAGLVSENCKTSVLTGIAETSRNTTSSILSKMKRFYKVDENGTPIDNYCYRTSCPVKVIDNFITTDADNFVVTDISTDKFDIVDLEGDKNGYSFGNLKVNKGDPGEIVGGQDLIFLSMMAKRFQKVGNFREYISGVLGKEVTTNLVTSFNKYENFNAKEWQTWMNAYQFGMPMDGRLAYNNPGEEAGLHHYQVMPAKADYKGDDYALSSNQFQVHQQFSGSYFDVDSGSVKEDEPLYSIAFYYEGHKHKDDIAVLSQSNVAGYKLSEPTIFNDDRFAGQIKDNVVYDDGNMVITSKTVDKGSDRTITTWDIKFNALVQSMVKDTSVTYGEWEPTKAPSTQYFDIGQAKSIQDTIDDYNEEHTSTSDKLLNFQDFNNDAKYWVSYDMSNYESDEEHDALYQYTKELSNLQTLDQKYKSGVSKFNDKFDKLNGKITIDDELSIDTVDEIVAKIKLLKEYGRDIKGFVEPDDTCSDYKLLANVNYQLGEELNLDGENKVIPNYYPSYVVEPVLSYKKGGETRNYELPIEVASILGT